MSRLILLLCCLVVVVSTAAAQFETRSTAPAGSGPQAIAMGDFNRDGKLDLAISNYNGDVTIMLGKGDGTFRTNATYAVGGEDYSIISGSFTKSGTLDLVVASQFNQAIYVLLGNGDGTFQPPVAYPVNGSSPAAIIGDFTGDGELDIAAITNSATCSCVMVFPGHGDGSFDLPVTTTVPYGISGFSLAAGHFDGNDKLDLAVVGFFGGANQVDILLGNGDGTFVADGFYSLFPQPEYVAVGDFNSDMKADLAVASGVGGGVGVLLGNGDGTFQLPEIYGVEAAPIRIADFGSNHLADLAGASDGGVYGLTGVNVFIGNGDGTFQPPMFYQAGHGLSSVATGDVNGDHLIDLVLADLDGNSVITLLNTGVVAFSPTMPVAFPFQLLGTTSKLKTVTLTNNGTSALTIASMTVLGSFEMTSTCGATVAPGGKCNINVGFSPTAKGMNSGTISINDSASSKPQVIELSGQGTVVQFSPSRLNFGSQKVGTKSAPQTITLTNQGTTALSITQIATAGPNARDFPQTNNCPASLDAGSSCTITVAFDPRKSGTRQANINATDNGGGSPQTVLLSGTGS